MCTVASPKLAHAWPPRQRKGLPPNNAHKPSARDPGVHSHPSCSHKSPRADKGRARLASTPTCLSAAVDIFCFFHASLAASLSVQLLVLRRFLRAGSRRSLYVALNARARPIAPFLRQRYKGTTSFTNFMFSANKFGRVRIYRFNVAHSDWCVAANPSIQGAASSVPFCNDVASPLGYLQQRYAKLSNLDLWPSYRNITLCMISGNKMRYKALGIVV